MTKRQIRKEAKQHILSGKTKQETFDHLKGIGKLPIEDLAKIIKSIPTLQAREEYKILNIILISLLALTVLAKMLTGIPIVIENGLKWLPILFIIPIVNIILLIGVATYWGESHKWVAILTILGLLRTLGSMLGQPFDPLILVDLSIAAGLIGLGFYLHSKLYTAYKIVKEPYQNSRGENRLRNVIRFED